MFESIKSKVVLSEDLAGIRSANQDKTIVFCSGCYDILQSGHAVFLNQCRDFGDMLVVGIGRDSTLKQLKGPDRPVNPQNNRIHLLAALQDVDYVVLNDVEIRAGKIDFKEVITQLLPDIFVLNQDDSAISEKKQLCDSLNIRIEFVGRDVPPELLPTSTTKIISKINYAYRAPLRIDFAGGWTDVPYIMDGKKGYVTNIAIRPLIELRNTIFNFSGYPRGSGVGTSTAVRLLEMISDKNYNAKSKSLTMIAEDLFTLENKELNWAIGRQDQYAIVFGGFHCFECGDGYAKPLEINIDKETLEEFQKNLLLLHTGISRNAQLAVEQVYQNHTTEQGRQALLDIGACGYEFANALAEKDFIACAHIMERNWEAQKQLASASTNKTLDEMYAFAKTHGAYGGKICGAGGGGAFVIYCKDPQTLKHIMKKRFVDCFEIAFEFEYQNITELNTL